MDAPSTTSPLEFITAPLTVAVVSCEKIFTVKVTNAVSVVKSRFIAEQFSAKECCCRYPYVTYGLRNYDWIITGMLTISKFELQSAREDIILLIRSEMW